MSVETPDVVVDLAPLSPTVVGWRPRTVIASLVASLVGVFVCFLGPIAGIVFGHIARSRIKRSGAKGSGLALAGRRRSVGSCSARPVVSGHRSVACGRRDGRVAVGPEENVPWLDDRCRRGEADELIAIRNARPTSTSSRPTTSDAPRASPSAEPASTVWTV